MSTPRQAFPAEQGAESVETSGAQHFWRPARFSPQQGLQTPACLQTGQKGSGESDEQPALVLYRCGALHALSAWGTGRGLCLREGR